MVVFNISDDSHLVDLLLLSVITRRENLKHCQYIVAQDLTWRTVENREAAVCCVSEMIANRSHWGLLKEAERWQTVTFLLSSIKANLGTLLHKDFNLQIKKNDCLQSFNSGFRKFQSINFRRHLWKQDARRSPHYITLRPLTIYIQYNTVQFCAVLCCTYVSCSTCRVHIFKQEDLTQWLYRHAHTYTYAIAHTHVHVRTYTRMHKYTCSNYHSTHVYY